MHILPISYLTCDLWSEFPMWWFILRYAPRALWHLLTNFAWLVYASIQNIIYLYVLFARCARSFTLQRYMIPLKVQNIVESNLVDDIFYKINEIYMHHATFLTFLREALKDWTSKTTIGDIISNTVRKQWSWLHWVLQWSWSHCYNVLDIIAIMSLTSFSYCPWPRSQ